MKKFSFILFLITSVFIYSCGSANNSDNETTDQELINDNADTENTENLASGGELSEDEIKNFIIGSEGSGWKIGGGEGDTYYFHKEGMIDLLLNDGEPTEFTGSWSITGNQMTMDTGYDGKKTAAVKIEGKNFIFGDVAFEPL